MRLLEETGGFNLYAFCGNDGVNRWDYLGMDAGAKMYEDYKYREALAKAATAGKLLNNQGADEDDPNRIEPYVVTSTRLPSDCMDPFIVWGDRLTLAEEAYERGRMEQEMRDDPYGSISQGHSSAYYTVSGFAQSFIDTAVRMTTYGYWSPYSGSMLYGTGEANPSGDIKFCSPVQKGARVGQVVQQLLLMGVAKVLGRASAAESSYVIDGESIRFDASKARLATAPSRSSGLGTSPETLATVGEDGQVMVFEGKHRVNLTLEGMTFSESVPGKPGWLEYQFEPGLRTPPGVPAGTWAPPLNKTSPLVNPSNPFDGLEGY